MSRPSSSAAAGRYFGIAVLATALFAPAFVVGIGESVHARGPAEFVLTSPEAAPEAPAEPDTASAPLGLFFPAGLLYESAAVPEPTWTQLAGVEIDLLPGLAYRSSLAPPPRRT